MKVKIAKWGNSSAVRLPKRMLEEAGLRPGDEVDITMRGNVVELRSRRRIPTIDELFAEALKKGPLESPPIVDWGPDVGAEKWPDDDWSDIAPSDAEMGVPNASRGRSRSRGR